MRKLLAVFSCALVASACAHSPSAKAPVPGKGEKHFKSLKQLTFEGTNAEAYFSPDGKRLIFQGHGSGKSFGAGSGRACDQMYIMNVDGSNRKLLSVDGGRNTCGYFIDNDHVLFSSTTEHGGECPKERDKSKGYVWEIFKSYDIYTSHPDGSEIGLLMSSGGYDAETTVCGGHMTFTSAREGNTLNVYIANTDGSNTERLTHEIGYNGGPFFSPDCTRIVYRAFHPTGKKEIAGFKKAVSEGYVPPSPLELYVMSSDGSNKKQLTAMGAASFAPSFYPKADKIIFSSNRATKGGEHPGRAFQLYAVSSDKALQTDAEAISSEGTFNGFPMFSPDGKFLVFASNRNSKNPHELNIFLAEWQE
jgi:Tol biopolymer transport system component